MITSTDFGSRLLSASAAIVVTIAALAFAIVPATPQATLIAGGLA